MCYNSHKNMLLTKTTAAKNEAAQNEVAQNEVALNYNKVRGLYFLAVVFVATIVLHDLMTLL